MCNDLPLEDGTFGDVDLAKQIESGAVILKKNFLLSLTSSS